MRKPKVATEVLVNSLADGKTMIQIAQEAGLKKYSIGRQVERLKQKHNCKTVTQLVVKLKLSGDSTT